jgi:hypothetical protein
MIEDYGRSKASDKFQFVAVQAGFYNTNMLHQQLVQKGPDGGWVFRAPISADTLVPSIDINEYGLWVRAAIEHKEVRDDGRAIPVCAEDISLREMIEDITKGQFVVLDSRRELKRSLPTATGTDIRIVQEEIPLPEGCPRYSRTWETMSGRPTGNTGVSLCVIALRLLLIGVCSIVFQGVDVKWPLQYLAKKPSTFKEWLAHADLSEYKN